MEERITMLNDFFCNGIEKCDEYEDYLTHTIGVLGIGLMASHAMHELYWKMEPKERLSMDNWHDYFVSKEIKFHL
jgi:hypothetical protein